MRPIKFRAWDREKKQMFEFSRGFAELSSFLEERSMHNGSEDDYDWMQFTGLSDKNGKEIYEEDIVKLSGWKPDICEVVFDRGGFCFRFTPDDTYYPDGKYLEDGEVIGNIYENPKLIT